MAIPCTPNPSALLAAAKCISCLTPRQRRAVSTLLLCQISNAMSTTPSGFQAILDTTGTILEVLWGPIPAGVTATEIWTSSNNVNFSLAATVPVPATSQNLTAPGVGTATYVKIRYDAGTVSGPFTGTLSVPDPVTLSWAQRVVINGGANPSAATISAINTFMAALPASLSAKIKAMNVIAPDSNTAALTPLVVGTGTDPWTTTNGAVNNGSLSVNGWKTADGIGDNQVLKTGVIPSAQASFNVGNGGVTGYFSAVPAQTGGTYNCGCADAAGDWFYLDMHDTGGNPPFYIFACFNNVAGAAVQSNNNYAGYFSGNLVAANNMLLYFANSTNAHAVLATQNTPNAKTPPTTQMYVGGNNNNGVVAPNGNSVCSFWAMHDALTASESLSFFNAIQALRTAFGGGFV